jgi:hypothetical protein
VPIQGFLRLRRFQAGKQSAFGTAVAATRVYPWRGAPTIDRQWTDPDIDTGFLDRTVPPYVVAPELTQAVSGPADYDSLPAVYSAGIKGGVTGVGGGAAKTWTYQAASDGTDPFEYFTVEYGDEVALDNVQLRDGIIETVTFEMPEDLGPWTVSPTWRFGKATYQVTRANLTAPANPIWMYGADTEIFLNDTSGTIGTTKLTDTLHAATITIENSIDQKRFANGSNTRFELAGYGRTARNVTASLTFAKQTASIQEVARWLGADPFTRYIEIKTTSPTSITGVTKYANSFRFAGRWYTREDGESGGNSRITMELRNFHDAAGLGYPLRTEVVCATATL